MRPDRGPAVAVGALVEEPAFWKYLSGRRNLEYFARAGAGSDRAGTRTRLARVDEVLETVGLTGAADKRVKAYSQGMRQRLGLGLALLGEPELLVLDEPTNGLDPSGMREMRLLLRSLADGGTTIFVSSHLLSEVEAMCDRVGRHGAGPDARCRARPGTLRGAADRIRVEVDDLARARATAAQLTGVTVDEPAAGATGPGSLRVTFAEGVAPADLNAALVRAGVRVHALVPERDTLEDVSCTWWRAPMYRVELAKALHRWRTWLLAAALAGVPASSSIAMKLSAPAPQNAQDAPPFLLQIVANGLYAAAHRPRRGAAVLPFARDRAVRGRRDRRRGAGRERCATCWCGPYAAPGCSARSTRRP